MNKYDKEVIKEEINKNIDDVSKMFLDNNIQLDTKPINMVSSRTYAKWDIMSRASGAMAILYKNNIFSPRKFKCYKCVCGKLHTENYCPKCGSGTCKFMYEEEIKMKYYIVVKDNRDEYIFLKGRKERTKNIKEAKLFQLDTIMDFGISICETEYQLGEFVCGRPDIDMFAIAESDICILGEEQTVYYRNNRKED